MCFQTSQVLRRRLDRVGGSSEDITALQQLLASFSDARRLPAAVTASSGSSSRDTQLPAPGAGGSVRKGAMIVFERNRAGDVTARVSWRRIPCSVAPAATLSPRVCVTTLYSCRHVFVSRLSLLLRMMVQTHLMY